MLQYVIRRILGSVLVVFMVSIVTFAIFQLAPALSHRSPIYYYVGKIPFPEGSPQLKLLEARFGFDKPLVAQYWYWLHGVLFGRTITDGTSSPIHCSAPCLGYSFRLNTSVNTLIAQAIPVSLSLAIGASILWLVGGVTIGTISGLHPERWWIASAWPSPWSRSPADLLHRPDPPARSSTTNSAG
jgi:peptide/nickel transport system permease protein